MDRKTGTSARCAPKMARALAAALASVGMGACGPVERETIDLPPDAGSELRPDAGRSAPAPCTDYVLGTNDRRVLSDGFGAVTVTGNLTTTVSRLEYDGRPARVSLVHKRDIDPHEDGCVADVGIALDIGGDCHLGMRFSASPEESLLLLEAAWLHVRSDCPGWPDEVEGRYELDLARSHARLAPPPDLPENVRRSCVPVTLAPTGQIRVRNGSHDLVLDLSELSFTGYALARGEETVACAAR